MNSMQPAPILLFVYKRPWHTEQTLLSLAANHASAQHELIVYADGPKKNATQEDLANIQKVHELIHKQTWCKKLTVHINKTNQGLANSVIKGVTETLAIHERVIVLEDDMLLSPWFLEYMNDGLDKYEQVEEVISIHGYCFPIDYPHPTFFIRGADCWGWATWRRGWRLFNSNGADLLQQLKQQQLLYDFDFGGAAPYSQMLKDQIAGKVDSWAIRWYASAFLLNKLTLYPGRSLVQNIGYDETATHKQDKHQTQTILGDFKVNLPEIEIKESALARKQIAEQHYRHLGIRNKIKKWLKWGH